MQNKAKNKDKRNINIPLSKENNEVPSDVLGSYTGVADDGGVPEQDADDL